ncbi:hypothetical protein B0H17DRAFT_1153804 [Mycena rosella]|uniref:Uncharacterized protein n=1 Tax=Mycena rosella TaxID=1033263 RepID=A0AAD7B340_MYCRO|nr:hypothetical protein B0H17DRAFT_1153804 [Mycena rosella]
MARRVGLSGEADRVQMNIEEDLKVDGGLVDESADRKMWLKENRHFRWPVTAVPSPVPFRRDFLNLHDGTATGRFDKPTAVEMTAVPVTGRSHSPTLPPMASSAQTLETWSHHVSWTPGPRKFKDDRRELNPEGGGAHSSGNNNRMWTNAEQGWKEGES